MSVRPTMLESVADNIKETGLQYTEVGFILLFGRRCDEEGLRPYYRFKQETTRWRRCKVASATLQTLPRPY